MLKSFFQGIFHLFSYHFNVCQIIAESSMFESANVVFGTEIVFRFAL